MRGAKNLGLLVANESHDEWYVYDLTPYGHELLAFLDAADQRTPQD